MPSACSRLNEDGDNQMDGFSAPQPLAHKLGLQPAISPWVKAMGVADELAVTGLTTRHLVTLAEHSIKTLDALADLASDELLEIVGEQSITAKQADAVIMAARAHWFE